MKYLIYVLFKKNINNAQFILFPFSSSDLVHMLQEEFNIYKRYPPGEQLENQREATGETMSKYYYVYRSAVGAEQTKDGKEKEL